MKEILMTDTAQMALLNSTERFAQTLAAVDAKLRSQPLDEAYELANKGFPVSAEDYLAVYCALTDLVAAVIPHLEATLRVVKEQDHLLSLAKETLLETEWRGCHHEWGDDGQLVQRWACPVCGNAQRRHEDGCIMGDTLRQLLSSRRSDAPELGVDTEARDG